MRWALLAIAWIVVVLLALPSVAAEDTEDLLGKWELAEAVLGVPAGSIWEFRKEGELVIGVKDKSLKLKYERKGASLLLETKMRKDTTEIILLTKTELVLKDNDGTTIKFKRSP